MIIEISKLDNDYKNGIIGLILLRILLFPHPITDTIDFLCKSVIFFLKMLLNNNDLGNLLQNVGIALLTILIPLAISVLGAFLEFERKEKNIEVLVLIDCVLNIKKLILGTFLCFSAPLFWQKSSVMFRSIELAVWFVGIIILTKILENVYKWIRTSDFQFYFLYLEKLEKEEEIVDAWNLVWQNKDMDFADEIKFLNIFSQKINALLKNKND